LHYIRCNTGSAVTS